MSTAVEVSESLFEGETAHPTRCTAAGAGPPAGGRAAGCTAETAIGSAVVIGSVREAARARVARLTDAASARAVAGVALTKR